MTTALVAGASGNLGSRIADHLLAQPQTSVRLLVRTGWADDEVKRDRIEPLITGGAEVVEGDVRQPATLDATTRGVDVVVSALQGQEDVIVDGQIALAHASVANGVRRFLPSDFAIDLFRAPVGPPQFAARQAAGASIDALDLEIIHVLSGGFMDQLLNPAFPWLVDVASGALRHWGTVTSSST